MSILWDTIPRILGWDKALGPATVWKDPLLQWQESSTYLLGEYLHFIVCLLGLIHACHHSRLHIFTWFLAFVAGGMNDLIFLGLGFLDCFWHSQATIQLTPRLPLYGFCLYNIFLYWPTVASWRSGFPLMGQAALAGLLSGVFFAPFDIVGVRLVWWTWHDSLFSLRERWLDVPFGSTVWTITLLFSFAVLLRLTTNNQPNVSFARMLFSFLVCALGTTVLMFPVSALFQALTNFRPGLDTLIFVVVTFGLIIGYSAFTNGVSPHPHDGLGKFTVSLWFLGLGLLGFFGIPENHRSTGFHQIIGPCEVPEFDPYTQTWHKEFLCLEGYKVRPWDFSCAGVPSQSNGAVAWYTVCGIPHENKILWLSILGSVVVVGMFLFHLALRDTTLKSLAKKSKKL